MSTVILIEGTWGGTWAHPDSPFRALLHDQGFNALRFQGWTGNVGGVPNILARGNHQDWIAGGHALGYFLDRLPYADRNLIAHSHGVAPALYAAALEQTKIRRLISVCSPVRADLQRTATAARPLIGYWRHVASIGFDAAQWAGELLDGHLSFTRTHKWTQAHDSMFVPKIGHSRLLNDPDYFARWSGDGLLDLLRAPIPPPGSEGDPPDGSPEDLEAHPWKRPRV